MPTTMPPLLSSVPVEGLFQILVEMGTLRPSCGQDLPQSSLTSGRNSHVLTARFGVFYVATAEFFREPSPKLWL